MGNGQALRQGGLVHGVKKVTFRRLMSNGASLRCCYKREKSEKLCT